jgi:DNA-binding Lrp family transcriptional regulator
MSARGLITLKDVELRLVSELMKNSRRSDRELAQVLGVSQPTVSRTIAKLKQQGVIREFTMIPDLTQLGFKIMAVIFLKLEREDRPLSPKQLEEMFSDAQKLEKGNPRPFLLVETGIGLQHDMMVIALFHDYSEYTAYLRMIRAESSDVLPYFKSQNIDSFLINLEEKHYQPLTLSRLAMILQRTKEGKRWQVAPINK